MVHPRYKFFLLIVLVVLSMFFGKYDGAKSLFHTYFPVIYSVILLSSIRNNVVRSALLTTFLLISSLSIIVRCIYGAVSKNMILAALGVDLKVSLGLLNQIPVYYYILIFIFIVFLSYISYTMKYIKLSRVYYFCISILLVWSLSNPIVRGLQTWGAKFFINNMIYDKSFVAQNYIDRYKIFFGDVIAAILIEMDAITDSEKYKVVAHADQPNFVFQKGVGEQNIIFIIGEASNVLRYSAYSYKRPTTPNLKHWRDDGSWCALENVHSSASQTRVAVPMYVSFADPEHGAYLFNYKNLIEMAKDNNYKTYWLDAQDGQGLWNKPFGFVERYADIHASPHINNTSFKITEGKDDNLIKPVEFYFKNAQGQSIFFIHLFGNHLPYDMHIDANDNGEHFDAYDKSIHHVDGIISKIKMLADKNFKNYKMIYVSDHGEVVGKGHGYPSSSDEMYLIPFLANNDDSCRYMEKFRGDDGFVSSNDVKYLILHLMGYEISDEKVNYEKSNGYKIKDYQENVIDFRKFEHIKPAQ